MDVVLDFGPLKWMKTGCKVNDIVGKVEGNDYYGSLLRIIAA